MGDNGLLGGKGGGTAKITVGAIFQLDGRLEVDGEDGKDNGGGGSGGSVWIRTGQLVHMCQWKCMKLITLSALLTEQKYM